MMALEGQSQSSFHEMKYRYFLYEGDDAIRAAGLILKHRLYVNGWSLELDARNIIRKKLPVLLAFCFHEKTPIGVGINFLKENLIQCFVREKFRRKGIGSKLVSMVKTPNCYHLSGIAGSEFFWLANNVKNGESDWLAPAPL